MLLLRRAILFAIFSASLNAAPVINEIMFHPPSVPENVAQEWIEIHNPDALPANVGGWRLSKGVN